jgi:antitoxin HicB
MTDEDMISQHVGQPYSRILVPDGSGRYFAEILEFPGCFSEGDTPGQAMDNLNEAMVAWIEAALESGQAIPDPIATAGYSGRVLLRLPKSLHREASRRAEMDGVSLNQFLVGAIAARVGADDLADAIADKLTSRLQIVAQLGVAVTTYSQPQPATVSPIGQLGEANTAQYQYVGREQARRRSHA